LLARSHMPSYLSVALLSALLSARQGRSQLMGIDEESGASNAPSGH